MQSSYQSLIPKKVLSVNGLAKYWDRTPATIYNYITKGRLFKGQRIYLQATKLGGGYLIHPTEIGAFLAALNSPPEAPKKTTNKINKSMAERIAKALQHIEFN